MLGKRISFGYDSPPIATPRANRTRIGKTRGEMENLIADLPTWLKYGMPTGLILVVLSRIILAVDSRLRESKTGLLVGTASVTLPVMVTLAFTGTDDQLAQEFAFVAATGVALVLLDWARLSVKQRMNETEVTEAVAVSQAMPPPGSY